LPANIRLGWKGITVANSLAYYVTETYTADKCIKHRSQAPGPRPQAPGPRPQAPGPRPQALAAGPIYRP
jgi:hypothetical protein